MKAKFHHNASRAGYCRVNETGTKEPYGGRKGKG